MYYVGKIPLVDGLLTRLFIWKGVSKMKDQDRNKSQFPQQGQQGQEQPGVNQSGWAGQGQNSDLPEHMRGNEESGYSKEEKGRQIGQE